MSETVYEVAQIREIVREVGRFGGIIRLLFVAERTGPESSETIAMSTEIEWQKGKELPAAELEDRSRVLHNLVLQSLLKDGWEPIGSDHKGRVMALRRVLGEGDRKGEGEQPIPADKLAWELTHPWRS